jgi:outer membrane protein assembly factor BamA
VRWLTWAALLLGSSAWSRLGLAQPRNELTVVPVVGGDSDVGLGAGYVASLARTRAGVKPYVWRIEAAGAITGKLGGGALRLGYLDDYLLFVVPRAYTERLRLELRAGYTDEPGLKYYGIGNASHIVAGHDGLGQYSEYERRRPGGSANATYRLYTHTFVTWGLAYAHNEVSYTATSHLAADLRSGDATTRRLLSERRAYEVAQFSYGAAWDTRDNEISTHFGQYHTLRIDLAPGGTDPVPFSWSRVNLALRAYLPLLRRRLTLAGRAVADLLLGSPPFYELSRFDDYDALGGGKGLRGVPAQRYYGKVKLFSNLELRSELFDFSLFGKRNVFGVTGFFDSGRLFSDYAPTARLDGTKLGLKYGVGGGVRVAAGSSFVLRGDVAWSPDARPIGAYLLAGQLF